jgi:hypothetical protein
VLVARRVGIVSAACISAAGRGTDRSSSDTYRHSAAHRCNANATNAGVMNTNARATNAGATTTACEGVS